MSTMPCMSSKASHNRGLSFVRACQIYYLFITKPSSYGILTKDDVLRQRGAYKFTAFSSILNYSPKKARFKRMELPMSGVFIDGPLARLGSGLKGP